MRKNQRIHYCLSTAFNQFECFHWHERANKTEKVGIVINCCSLVHGSKETVAAAIRASGRAILCWFTILNCATRPVHKHRVYASCVLSDWSRHSLILFGSAAMKFEFSCLTVVFMLWLLLLTFRTGTDKKPDPIYRCDQLVLILKSNFLAHHNKIIFIDLYKWHGRIIHALIKSSTMPNG